ncbi:MAG TPA: hypothetical protein VH080_10245 [Gemmatimonadaceae bacterium]|nr:hypothetical protein [Gemmatimonadaceae bacterium]
MQARTSAGEWQKRIERWRESGLTADQFAAELGINAGTLRFWGYKLNKAKSGESDGATAQRERKKTTAPTFVEVRTEGRDAGFELELSRGRRLRVPQGFDAKALVRLLAVLDPG